MPSEPTPYADVNELIADLLAAIQGVLGPKIVGVYLYGSLITGDFDHGSSDVDLLVALTADLDERDLAALEQMHDAFAQAHAQWAGRIEVGYLPVSAFQTFRTRRSPIAVISPGEPFHLKDAGADWLLNWYVVREQGVTLAGPPPQTIIPPISQAEWLQTVRAQAQAWRTWVDHSEARPSQGYAILTMCRALYALRQGTLASKPQAAQWAAQAFPEWAPLIQNALAWRAAWREPVPDPAATLPQTRRFVQFMADQCEQAPPLS